MVGGAWTLPITEKPISCRVCEAHEMCALREGNTLEEVEGYEASVMFELAPIKLFLSLLPI
jgi:hypothetical protein